MQVVRVDSAETHAGVSQRKQRHDEEADPWFEAALQPQKRGLHQLRLHLEMDECLAGTMSAAGVLYSLQILPGAPEKLRRIEIAIGRNDEGDQDSSQGGMDARA